MRRLATTTAAMAGGLLLAGSTLGFAHAETTTTTTTTSGTSVSGTSTSGTAVKATYTWTQPAARPKATAAPASSVTMTKPTYTAPQPKVVYTQAPAPAPTYTAPAPAPAPTKTTYYTQAPKPVYTQAPKTTYVAPKTTYVAPKTTYVAPKQTYTPVVAKPVVKAKPKPMPKPVLNPFGKKGMLPASVVKRQPVAAPLPQEPMNPVQRILSQGAHMVEATGRWLVQNAPTTAKGSIIGVGLAMGAAYLFRNFYEPHRKPRRAN